MGALMTIASGVITIATRLTFTAWVGALLCAGCSSPGAKQPPPPQTPMPATSAPPAAAPGQPPDQPSGQTSGQPPGASPAPAAGAAAGGAAAGGTTVSNTPRPCPSKPGEACVTGTIFYRERMALPPTATIRLQLADVSLADAPAKVLDEYAFASAGKQPPFDVALRYDPAAIDPRHDYAVQARIELDGQLLFISDTRVSVITRGNPTTVNVMLVRVKSPAP